MDMEHCSDYVFTDKEIEESKVVESTDNKADKNGRKDADKQNHSSEHKMGTGAKILLIIIICVVFLGIIGTVLYLLLKKGILKKSSL